MNVADVEKEEKDLDAKLEAFRCGEFRDWLRKMERRRRWIVWPTYLAALAVLPGTMWLLAQLPVQAAGGLIIILFFAVLSGGYKLALRPMRRWQTRFADEYYSKLFGLLGYRYVVMAPSDFTKLVEAQYVLPQYDKAHVTRHVSGEIGDTAFAFANCRLESKARPEDKPPVIFNGLFGSFTFRRPFRGTTVAYSHSSFPGARTNRLPDGVSRVHLESPEFEQAFDVYSTDQVEARYLLTPAFMERVLKFRMRSKGVMSLAFHDSRLFVAVHLDDEFFEAPSPHFNLDDILQFRRSADAVLFIDASVRILKLNQETRV